VFLAQVRILNILILICTLSCLIFLMFTEDVAGHITGLQGKDPSGRFCVRSGSVDTAESSHVYLLRALGKLTIDICASSEIYQAYFHIPISCAEQVPIAVSLDSPHLIDYRFLSLEPPNLIVAARMHQALETSLDWEVWVLAKENRYQDLPEEVPIPSPETLPDSVTRWLQATDCVQVQAPIVQQTADSLGRGVSDLIALADTIRTFCQHLPGDMSHYPFSFDAVYALNWGSSCTGHAHAGAALFRALGVPARCLLVMPTWAQFWYDMHWIIEIYVPGYGWVKLETTLGQFPCYPHENIVVLACHPEDEFPLFYPSGIEGYWHTSDPTLGVFNPHWGQAHRVLPYADLAAPADRIEYARTLTDSVFQMYTQLWGVGLGGEAESYLQTAAGFQNSAVDRLKANDLDGYIADMEAALQQYLVIETATPATIFFDDFESGSGGWTHGGTHDEWECGWPATGPDRPHSGAHCWGTDLDGLYENEAENWLCSPPIDLSGLCSGQLSFWIWNWVQDESQGFVYDPLWMSVITAGDTREYLCSYMGGVNDDPLIPDVGGWTKMALDLTPYVGDTLQLCFHFESDLEEVQYGAYIDDVHVLGRTGGQTEVSRSESPETKGCFTLLGNHPNPFNAETVITFRTDQPMHLRCTIYNILGQEITTILGKRISPGLHRVTWRGRDRDGVPVSSGIYFYCLQSEEQIQKGRLVLIR
jgi:transglutaminase-like putative cysteine protease